MIADPVLERALRAVALTRTQGLHFLGHFVGISGRPTPVGTVKLTLAAPETDGPIPLLSFSVFADLVLTSAIRSHVGAGARLGTVTLSIQHRRSSVRGPVIGQSRAPEPRDGYGISNAIYTIGDEIIGHGHGTASALPPPEGRAPQLLPWERDPLPPVPSLSPSDLEPHEARFLATVEAAQARARAAGTTVEDELLDFAWQPTASGNAHGELTIGPELGNRVGHLQGGALYAAGARVAAQALAEGSWVLAEGSYQFLRPGDGGRLTARAEVLRRGRTAAFVETRLYVDEVAIGAGLYTFRADT